MKPKVSVDLCVCVCEFMLPSQRHVSSNLLSHVGDSNDIAMEADGDACGEPAAQREEPLGGMNGKSETDDKENNNGTSTDETHAVR